MRTALLLTVTSNVLSAEKWASVTDSVSGSTATVRPSWDPTIVAALEVTAATRFPSLLNCTRYPSAGNGLASRRTASDELFQNDVVPSPQTTATSRPSPTNRVRNRSHVTRSVGGVAALVRTSQTVEAPSPDAVTTCWPSGLNTADFTGDDKWIG